jgi:sulfide:quinone oxidoreductase
VHIAKAGFERYFLGKVKRGISQPFFERMALDLIGAKKLKGL